MGIRAGGREQGSPPPGGVQCEDVTGRARDNGGNCAPQGRTDSSHCGV